MARVSARQWDPRLAGVGTFRCGTGFCAPGRECRALAVVKELGDRLKELDLGRGPRELGVLFHFGGDPLRTTLRQQGTGRGWLRLQNQFTQS